MDDTIDILIADDHELIRKGLRQILDMHPEFRITEAENGTRALELIEKNKPDVAVLDVEMPGKTGLEVAKVVRARGFSVELILLTMHKDQRMVNKALDMGIKGYVLKENSIREVVQSIRTVYSGESYLSPELAESLKTSLEEADDQSCNDSHSELTNMEKKIIRLLPELKTNQRLAEEFGISIRTIHNHRLNICKKLGLRGAHALLQYAMEQEYKDHR